jgi:signal transduction histidine kinase
VSSIDPDHLSLSSISALIAGVGPWHEPSAHDEAWQRLIAVVEVVALTAGASAIWRLDIGGPSSAALGYAGSTALALLLLSPIARAAGRPVRPSRYGTALAVRLCLGLLAVASLCVLLPGWSSLWALPIGVAAGADAILTCNEIGVAPAPLRWWRRFLISPLHAVICCTTLLIIAVGEPSIRSTAAIALACMHVWLLATALAASLLVQLGHAHSGERSQALDDVVWQDRRQRAHWLHDDICAELHAVALRLQSQRLSTEDAVALINDVDHRVRLRQLDELLDSGKARVGEILQPFIRRVHNAGLAITSVPSFEMCAKVLSSGEARLASRAAMELTTNALESGATEIAYGVAIDDDQGLLRLTVSDNGPGFGLADVTPGGGLWLLRDDLGIGGISVSHSPNGGAAVTADIALGRGGQRGHASTGR